MSSQVKEVEYYYAVVADVPGESRRLLDFLSEKKVNLLALTAFPVGDGDSQIDFIPADPEALKAAAADAEIPPSCSPGASSRKRWMHGSPSRCHGSCSATSPGWNGIGWSKGPSWRMRVSTGPN